MALERNLTLISVPASGDLSASQFHIAVIDANGRAAIGAGTAGKIIGVLYNKPNAISLGADIAISGVARVVAGGSVAAGDLVTSDGAGFAVTCTGQANVILGRAISNEAVGSGDIFECLLSPGNII